MCIVSVEGLGSNAATRCVKHSTAYTYEACEGMTGDLGCEEAHKHNDLRNSAVVTCLLARGVGVGR